MVRTKSTALAALATLITSTAAHSWVEQMMVINGQGQFTGTPGYARNATARTTPGFSDLLMVHILPSQGQPSIEERDASPTINATDIMDIAPTDPMCKKTQQQQIQGSGLPRLSAAPGSMLALRYQENGHITLPQNQMGKPPNRGTVYIYGTTQPKPEENFLDVFNKWNADGSGGDKRGQLLATQSFDDGQCYQINSGSISQQRQQQFPHPADKLMGTDLWCQNDIKIPTSAPSGKPYTLYWVWDWPTEAGVDPNLPKGKAEIYTTCMDIDITTANKRGLMEVRALAPQVSANPALNSAAIPAYMSSLTGSSAAPTEVSAPASSAPPAPAPESMNPAAAASIVEAALAPEISSMLAAQSAAITITVTPPISTVTVTAGVQSAAAQPAVSQSPSSVLPSIKSISIPSSTTLIPSAAAVSANIAPTVSSAASPAIQASPAVPAGSPPASLSIQPPVISGLSGTATEVTATSASITSSTVVSGASQSFADKFSGTATPVGSTAPSAAAASPAAVGASCPSGKCRAVKRSKILGGK